MLVFYFIMCFTILMQISGMAVERLRDAAEALLDSPVDYVQTSVPTFEETFTDAFTGYNQTILHPLVDGPREITDPYQFHTFNISATEDNSGISFRLSPQLDLKVSAPILSLENPKMIVNLPRIGYTALRGQIFDSNNNERKFYLIGEDEVGNTSQILDMPDEVSVERISLLIAGQVQAKAIMASILPDKDSILAVRV